MSEDPCLLVIDGFLSPRECAAVRQLGGPHLKRSKVSTGDETHLRTSSGMFVVGELQQHPTARHLDDRVTQLTQARMPLRQPLRQGVGNRALPPSAAYCWACADRQRSLSQLPAPRSWCAGWRGAGRWRWGRLYRSSSTTPARWEESAGHPRWQAGV